MSAATEKQNNGDVAVEKVAADAVKDDLKSQKANLEDNNKPAAADNGTASKDEAQEEDSTDAAPAKENTKGTKRPVDGKSLFFPAKHSESKKAKVENVDSDSDELPEKFNESGSESEEEYDINYGEDEEDGVDEDNEEEDEDESGSDDQA